MELEEKIRRTRQQRGLTQEALAERLEVSRQAVAKWEHGGARPSTENLIALSRVLEVPLEELTGAAPAPRSRLPRLPLALALLLALAAAASAVYDRLHAPPEQIIGYADAATQVYVTGVPLLPRLLALSALGVVVVTLWVYLRRREG